MTLDDLRGFQSEVPAVCHCASLYGLRIKRSQCPARSSISPSFQRRVEIPAYLRQSSPPCHALVVAWADCFFSFHAPSRCRGGVMRKCSMPEHVMKAICRFCLGRFWKGVCERSEFIKFCAD
ncbi:unnamed protein product [Calypogeia fissa]